MRDGHQSNQQIKTGTRYEELSTKSRVQARETRVDEKTKRNINRLRICFSYFEASQWGSVKGTGNMGMVGEAGIQHDEKQDLLKFVCSKFLLATTAENNISFWIADTGIRDASSFSHVEG